MIEVFQNSEELNNFAADKFVEIAAESISERGRFTVALAGGSTPKSLYRLLSGDKFKDKIDWSKVFFFFGDERNVSPDDAESNFRMAHENLFAPLEINVNSIFPWLTQSETPEITAEIYQGEIKRFFDLGETEFPIFDLILLGMGADGHTASLFPFTKALGETEKIAVANPVEKLNTTRLTLTFPTINVARNIIFLVAGEDKAETLREVLEGKFQPERLPSQNVKPENGNLYWLLDENVAKLLRTYGN
ncbi:MAG: 6-phosphogluconolactonase [Pyrinomonadaceae bacterium]|nr:6-phosphogluconolactonase [Pyrinomonadaceae bacterium]